MMDLIKEKEFIKKFLESKTDFKKELIDKGKLIQLSEIDPIWEREPNELRFTDEDTGLECYICRHERGHLCGYVIIPENHPLYESRDSWDYWKYPIDDLEVHGDITFAGKYHAIGEYVIGFDCAHAGDISPYNGYEDILPGSSKLRYVFKDEIYRDMEYVKGECKRLAKQIKEMEQK
jgi:hypothetical protein